MTKDEPGVEAVARQLVFAAGELVVATDEMEQLRPKRQAVLDAMKGTTDALLREPQHSDVRETLSDCAEFLADIDGDLAQRCEAAIASLSQDKRERCPTCGCTNDAFVCSNGFHAPLVPQDKRIAVLEEALTNVLSAWDGDAGTFTTAIAKARAVLNGGSND